MALAGEGYLMSAHLLLLLNLRNQPATIAGIDIYSELHPTFDRIFSVSLYSTEGDDFEDAKNKLLEFIAISLPYLKWVIPFLREEDRKEVEALIARREAAQEQE